MKSAILTIGTEITDGQIVDRNSQWISAQLDQHSIKTVLHMSVPDQREDMLSAIEYSLKQADLVFICGGLGPTSDDFTRDIVAEYLKTDLVLHEPTWQVIQSKLATRGVTLREGHKNQAMIPKQAQVLDNDAGVAPGFYVEIKNKKLWALPGPPKEIEAIWHKHILPKLEKGNEKFVLKTWACVGPESELAFITEEFFSKFNFSKKYGYRFQTGVVEVKLWYEKESVEAGQAIQQFSDVIKKYLKN